MVTNMDRQLGNSSVFDPAVGGPQIRRTSISSSACSQQLSTLGHHLPDRLPTSPDRQFRECVVMPCGPDPGHGASANTDRSRP